MATGKRKIRQLRNEIEERMHSFIGKTGLVSIVEGYIQVMICLIVIDQNSEKNKTKQKVFRGKKALSHDVPVFSSKLTDKTGV